MPQYRVTLTATTPIDTELIDYLGAADRPGETLAQLARIGYMVASRKLTGGGSPAADLSIPDVTLAQQAKSDFMAAAADFDDD